MYTKWDDRWMDLANLISKWSKDRAHKFGAVIVDDRNVVVSLGWNGFPRRVDDDKDERHERPTKYKWVVHAETNAIYNAAANGPRLLGCKLYVNSFPCAECAKAIAQAGIIEVIAKKGDPDLMSRWAKDMEIATEMLQEAGVMIRFYEDLRVLIQRPLDTEYILGSLKGHSIDSLRKKALQLKQTDGEGWAIGDMLERILEEA